MKKLNTVIICILFSMQSLVAAEPDQSCATIQKDSLLCSLPVEIICHITSFLQTWKEIHNLGQSCKFLDECVTIPRKKIVIWRRNSREDQTCAEFLGSVGNLVRRIAKKSGNNPIILHMPDNQLADDNQAFEKFLSVCSDGDLDPRIVDFDIALNGLSRLPQTLACLKHLKSLEVGENPLNQDDLKLIASLVQLKDLNISACGLKTLPEEITNLQNLTRLNLAGNLFAKDVLPLVGKLGKLEEVSLSDNSEMTLAAIRKSSCTWPCIKTIYATHLPRGEDFDSCCMPNVTIYA